MDNVYYVFADYGFDDQECLLETKSYKAAISQFNVERSHGRNFRKTLEVARFLSDGEYNVLFTENKD